MKRKTKHILALALLIATGVMPTFAQVSNDNEDEVNRVSEQSLRANDFVPGEVLVKFKDASPVVVRRAAGRFQSVDKQSVNSILQDFGTLQMEKLLPSEKPGRKLRKAKAYNGQVVQERDLSQLYHVKLQNQSPDSVLLLVKALEELPEVEYAEPNYRAYIMVEEGGQLVETNENPYYSQQWGLTAYGVDQLWNKPIVNGKRPVIAIIDTGVDMTHPDLVDNLWTNTAEAEGVEGYDNDGNGFVGDVHGWDFVNNTGNVRDNHMHGTHVAGIAAAANNGIGIIGANPQALIMPVAVMQSDGSGDVGTIIKGVNYAVQNGATVLNLSLGNYIESHAFRQALANAYHSAVIVAAAGNDGKNIEGMVPAPCFPAAWSFVLGVQATQQYGGLASFSNFDPSGPIYSPRKNNENVDGYNYELRAPGKDILSTIPGGKYKELNGTSMASPLVAGAVSALMMVKEYDNQEILWGDLLHTNNIGEAYSLEVRPAELDFVGMMRDERKELGADDAEVNYSGDGEIDAGETVSFYPIIRTTFGAASNIKLHLEMGDEFEDPSTVQFLDEEDVDFGLSLDAYGRGVSMNPVRLKVADNIADRRVIKLKMVATCAESETSFQLPFTITANNMIKIGGLISEDRTLTADHVYYVNENLGVTKGTTLTIEPGTRLEFAEGKGLNVFGKLKAKGMPEKPIVFTSHVWYSGWGYEWGQISTVDTLSYCIIENNKGFATKQLYYPSIHYESAFLEDCIITHCQIDNSVAIAQGKRNTVKECLLEGLGDYGLLPEELYSNYVNNSFENNTFLKGRIYMSNIRDINVFNINEGVNSSRYWYDAKSDTPKDIPLLGPCYLGTGREDLVRPHIEEIGNADTWGYADLSAMRTAPFAEAHGIVWKVVVNGKDAQDEYEDLAPLGNGKHQFEVYFNRPMNKEVAPKVFFGVRDPYTQNAVDEDGSWNEEGTIYTVYKTISAKTKSDGVNRIYVYGAEDNEFFECPYEKTRFNVLIQSAGSLATGFAAEAGMGKVTLTWNNENNNFDDAMGFNVYRIDEAEDTVRLNSSILDIEETEYIDYDVVPGHTYSYYYKVLSTSLEEYDVSNVVSATALTATLGDANGSGDVDVADVITTVNYAAGLEPRPFIFEAADMNTDLSIDILDVIGIIQKILHPEASTRVMAEAEAVYTIEDGVLYVESPVALAGVQVQLNMDEQKNIAVADDLHGFEQTSAWLSDNDYLFLAYSLNGKTLSPGKHALLVMGDSELATLRLSDAQGHNVKPVAGKGTTAIDAMASKVMTQGGIFNLKGQKVAGKASDLKKLPRGVYIVNGEKVVK